MTLTRRDAVLAGLTGAVLGGSARGGEGPVRPRLGPPATFSFEALDASARRLSARPFRPRALPWSRQVQALDFDALGAIRFRQEAALWPDDPKIGAVEFFHPGRYAADPVEIHVVEQGLARRIAFARDMFDIPPGSPALSLPTDIGFSGFRVMNPHAPGDWIAFQGASYFRSADPFNQYGLSARGLAIDTAASGPEEFPAFTAFWLERAADLLVVYALLDGPSVAGAYQISHRRSAAGLTQDIEARLHFRKAVGRLGLAPLTSMYWYRGDDRRPGVDWRPAVHDSDGLALVTGHGEQIWRPLTNPPRLMVNAFQDQDPKRFGLMQRDRVFADFQDDGAFYDRRPSAWVEPLEGWGKGSVQLVEIPTDSETNDNIVAFWTPEREVRGGDSLRVRYRLHWADEEPDQAGIGRAVASRTGAGGRPGLPPESEKAKIVIDFEGGRLAELARGSGVVAVVSADDGALVPAIAYPVVGASRWRLMFDIRRPEAGKCINLRAYLRTGDEALTETWIGQIMG